jgi:cysteinyl-tRNA synthetase
LQISHLTSHISHRKALSEEKLEKVDAYRKKFDDALANDLNMPQALAVAWEVVKSNIPSPDKYDLVVDFDEVLGLRLNQESGIRNHGEIPADIEGLLKEREILRRENKFTEADAVRKAIESKGFLIEDTTEGTKVSAKP